MHRSPLPLSWRLRRMRSQVVDAVVMGSTVPFYVAARPRYPEQIVAAVARLVGLGQEDRVLDLGAGPGFLAIPFTKHAGHVIAMDPDPDMVAAARTEMDKAGVALELIQGGSEDLGPHLAPLTLVTMGRSFQWMDREATLLALDPLIVPRGAVALLSADKPAPGHEAWYESWRSVRSRWARRLKTTADKVRAAGKAVSDRVILERSAFRDIIEMAFHLRQQSSIEDLVRRALSTTHVSPEKLGRFQAVFEEEIREAVRPFAVDGMISEVLLAKATIAFRPGILRPS